MIPHKSKGCDRIVSASQGLCRSIAPVSGRPARPVLKASTLYATQAQGAAQPSTSELVVTSEQQQRQAQKIKLARRDRSISWERWELLMFERENDEDDGVTEEAGPSEADPVLLAAGGEDDASVSASSALSAGYFSHFDDPLAHEPYLADKVLINAYRQAITGNAALMKGKVVLDLGCGPAHLAIMCAQAGAKRVYAVEASEGAAAMAQRVVSAAGLSGIITVLQGDVEQLQLGEQVDVIVSDWMGPMLLGGGMLRSVALAKQRLLKPGGVVLPDLSELFVVGVEDRDYLMGTKERFEKLAGFDMSAAMTQVVKQPRLDSIARESQVFTAPHSLITLDLSSQDSSALRTSVQGFSMPFQLTALREERLFALMLYWDVSFSGGGQAQQPHVVLSTDPRGPPTSFQQLLLNLPKSIRMAKGAVLSGTITCRPSQPDHRRLDVEVQVEFGGVTASTAYSIPALLRPRNAV